MKTKVLSLILFLLFMPAVCIIGAVFFKDRSSSFIIITTVIALLSSYIFVYEKKNSPAHELVLIALMSAMSVLGRIVFAFAPSLKPCTAIIILTGIYLDRETGFMVGAFTALVSNFYFGQGSWTPFQMLAWGVCGYIAGLFGKRLIKNRIMLLIYSAVSGVMFSLLMDLYTCLWIDGTIIVSRYIAFVTAAVPVTISYAVSNVIFTTVFMQPFGRIFDRLCTKYGINNLN